MNIKLPDSDRRPESAAAVEQLKVERSDAASALSINSKQMEKFNQMDETERNLLVKGLISLGGTPG